MVDTTFNLENVNIASFKEGEPLPDYAIKKTDRLRSSMSEAVKVNPDQFSENFKLSEASGIPEWAVQGNPKEVEQHVELQKYDFSEMSKRSPNTSEFLIDYNNAAIAQDDVSVLEKIEATFQNIGATSKLGFKEQALGMALQSVEFAGLGREGIHPKIAQAGEDLSNMLIGEITETQVEREDLTPENLSLMQEGVRSGVESIINIAPSLALAIATRDPYAMLIPMGLQTESASYAGARAEGLSIEESANFAFRDGAIEVLTEMIPVGTLMKIVGGSGAVTKEAFRFAVQEMGTEQIATFAQSLNALAFGMDEELAAAETIGEKAAIHTRRAAVTAIATVIAGGSQVGITVGVRKIADKLTQEADSEQNQSEIEQNQIDYINTLSTDSKLKQRNPGKFYQLIQKNDGDNNTQVYLNADKVAEYLADQEIASDGALILLKETLDQTVAGEDVAVPVAAFATVIAGTVHFDALRGSMTLNEQSLSPEAQEQARATAQEYITDLVAEAQQNVTEYVEAQQIFETVRAQLIDSGQVQPQNAAAMAQLVPAWATVFAKENGVTIQEAYEQSGLTIVGPQTGVKADLDQQKADLGRTTNNYNVKTEDDGDLEVQIIRSKDGSVTIFHPEGTIEHNAEFSEGKTDEELLAYSFEPRGYTESSVVETTPAAPETETTVTRSDQYLDLLSDDEKVFFEKMPVGEKRDRAIKSMALRSDNNDTVQAANSLEERHKAEDALANPESTHAERVAATMNIERSAPYNSAQVHDVQQDLDKIEDRHQGVVPDSFSGSEIYEVYLTSKKLKESQPESSVVETTPDSTKPTLFQRAKEFLGAELGIESEAAAVERLNRAETEESFEQSPVPTATLKDIAAKFDQEILDKHGKRLDAKTPENKEIISEQLAEETLIALGTGENAAEWYKQSISSAMEFAAKIHPELATDPAAMTVFKVIMAITSNGASVQENTRNAEFMYNKYKETGRIPEQGFGKEAGAMVKGFKRFNELVDMMGLEKVQEFLDTPRTVRELKEMGFNVNGENVDEIVPTSAVFGPKIGIFFQNLIGNFNHVTMDRWFMRTWGRMTGAQLPVYEKAFPARAAKLRETIKALPVKELFGYKRPQLMKNDELLMEFAELNNSRYTASGFNDKSDVNKQSKNLFEGVTAPIIDPKNGGNRAWMREVMKETQQKLADKGQDLDLATIQALLWYAEKDLYINNGIRAARVEATDYEQEFRKLADQRLGGTTPAVGEGRSTGPTRPNGQPAFEQRGDIEDDKSARGYYNPDNSVIRLAEASDLSTFLHEFAHFMYEQELKAGSKNATDIQKWFKVNAADVAKEANLYLKQKVEGDLRQVGYLTDKELIDTVDAQGGVTLNPDGSVSTDETGYVVSLSSEETADSELIPELVDNALKAAEPVAAEAELLVGVFKKDDGTYTIDINTRIENKEEAIALGKKNNQISIWDNANFAEIKTGGDGLATVGLNFQDLLDQILEIKGIDTGRDSTGKLVRPPVVDGQIILEHYSKKQGLENLDPEFFGTNYAGREKDRSNEPNWEKRTYYGIETGKKGGYRKEYGTGNYEYRVSVPAEKMYDLMGDPDGLKRGDGVTNYESRVKAAGYDGYWIIQGQLGMVAAVFTVQTPLRQETDIPQGVEGVITEADVNQFLDETTTGDANKDAALRRATHEQFARGFEAYLLEGKAPSVELRNVFRSFARWLAEVYKRMSGNLNVNLTDEMRAIFDRMLATEEQLDMARAREQVKPLFTDAAMAGMTDAAFAEYEKNVSTAKDVESETLREKVIEELTRQTKSWWKDEKADMVVEEIARLSEEKVYRAIVALRNTDLKIDRGVVRELLGEDRVDKRGRKSVRIPEKLNGMTAPGSDSVHPDEAAAFLDYNSGDEMLTDILAAPRLRDAAEAAAEARMLETHGDILNDGTIEQQAAEALQNEERGKLLLRELKQINKTVGAPTLTRQAMKDLAEENIGKLSFRQIQPGKYQKAKETAGKEAAVAQAQGDMAAASRAKSREILNFYLAKAATDARNNTLKIVDRMKRYNKKSVREEIMKAENGYWEQLVKILSRFEFRKSATLTAVDQKNESLNVWVNQMLELEGDGLVLSPEVLDEGYQTHWKNVPYDSLLGINESVKNIEHVARYATKMDLYGEEIAFEQLVQRWDDHLNAVAKDKYIPQRTDATKGRNTGRWAMAQMSKIPWMASWLDGGERAGMSHEILMSGLNDALYNEIEMMGAVTKVVTDAISDRSRAAMKRGMTKFFIPEIKDANNDGNLMGNQIIAVALNTGNQGNLRKMLLGEGWANKDDETTITIENPKLQAVLQEMTSEDWDLVELIWQQMNLLYPQLAEVHRKTTGLVPPKVQDQAFSIGVDRQQRTIKGGYYPLKYDPARSEVARKNEENAAARVDSMFSTTGSIQSSVNAASTNERTGFYAPILLDLSVVPNHFQETIHFITHHDAVRQINKLIRNKTIANTISRKLGPEEFAELKPWLNDIAKLGSAAPTKTFIDAIFQKLRFGVTLGVMGFKATTGLMQVLGLSNSIAEVGLTNMLQSFGAIMGSPKTMQEAWEFALENSKVLAHRTSTMDREIGNAMKQLEGKRGVIAAVQETSMKHIALIQVYSVDLPSWYAAYIKEMKNSGDEKKAFSYADWVIENVQGSGATKDMARIMRNQSKTHTTFTMFMTFFSSLWNQQRDTARSVKSGLDTPTTTAAKAAFIIGAPVIMEMMMRGEFGGEDDDDGVYQKTLTRLALYPFASIPWVRDAVSGVAGEFGYNMTPVASVLEQGLTRVPGLVEALVTDEELTKGEVKAVSKLVGASLGIPGINQAWATGEHIYQVLEEGEDLTARQLLFGPTRD